MQITRNSLDTSVGPSDWFTGSVYLDTIAAQRLDEARRHSIAFLEHGGD